MILPGTAQKNRSYKKNKGGNTMKRETFLFTCFKRIVTSVSIVFVLLVLMSITTRVVFSQSESVEIVPDKYTMVLDHFNGKCAENCRYVGYVNSLPGLDRAANFTPNAYSIYQIPWNYCRTIDGQGTFEFWLYTRQYNVRLVSAHNNYNSGPTFMGLSLLRNGRLAYYTWPHGTAYLYGKSPVPLLEWTHIAVSWGPSGTSIYINGKQDAWVDKNFRQYACTYMGHHFIVGKGSADIGYFDEFHVSFKERTADEIAQHGSYHEAVPRLTLGVPLDDTISSGKSRLYKVTTEPGKDLLLTLNQTAAPVELEFYGRKGNYPSTLRYDVFKPAQNGKAQQVIIFLKTAAPETYYFLVRGSGTHAEPSPYTILAKHPGIYVAKVSPASGGNAGEVTLGIEGCQLTKDISVTLISPTGTSITGSSPLLYDTGALYTTVNLNGAVIGLYDVKIEKPGLAPILLKDAFNITAGIGPRLEVKLKVPPIIRSNRRNTAWLEYKNTGDADAGAPVFYVENSPNSTLQTGTYGRKSDKDLFLLGLATDCPPGIIPPDSSFKSHINYTAFSGDSVKLKAKMYQPDDTPVNWDTIKSLFRPPLVEDGEWQQFWEKAVTPMGTTGKEVLENVYAVLAGADGDIDYMMDFPGLLKAALALSGITGEAASNFVSQWMTSPAASFNPSAQVHVLWYNGFNSAYDCTYIVSHGWNSNPTAMEPLASAIKKHCSDCNIALINWETGAMSKLPFLAAKNTRAAAEEAYKKLKGKVKDYDFNKMVYVGHSFGNVVNKYIAGNESDGYRAKGRAVILDPPSSMGGFGRYGQPDFYNFYKGSASSYSSGSPADAWPCISGRIADRQLYTKGMSHGQARDCLKDVLNSSAPGDCSNDWLKGQIPVSPGKPGAFDGRINCDGSYSKDLIDPCIKYPPLAPFLPWKPVYSAVSYIFRPADPNEKVGTFGAGPPDHFIRSGDEVTYTVFFENKPEATAPAQEVFITDDLDSDLDWSTLRFGEIAFGDKTVVALAGKRSGFTSVMKDGYRVDIEALFDLGSGRIHWIFRTLDPKTGEWPEDPLAGFLPPNDPATGSGEGHVTFTIKTKEGLADGTEITNKADIVFDTEAKIETNTWKNIINSQVVVNVPPVANAGEDITIYSKDTAGTFIVGAAGDEDPDDILNYTWKKGNTLLLASTQVGQDGKCPLDLGTVSLGVGTHTLTLEVTDGTEFAADNMVLTVKNSPPSVQPGGSGTYEINTKVTLSGSVSDYDGDLLNWKWLLGTQEIHAGTVQTAKGGAAFPIPDFSLSGLALGTHTITLQVKDGVNDPVTGEINVEIVDTTPPVLAPYADRTTLWPPNQKMEEIVITANASDNSGLPVLLGASVSSSAPVSGGGAADKSPDWTEPVTSQEKGLIILKLRAERFGFEKQGRVYTVTITAVDTSNNKSTAIVEVTVPHDKKKE
jgi:hypothetical protein